VLFTPAQSCAYENTSINAMAVAMTDRIIRDTWACGTTNKSYLVIFNHLVMFLTALHNAIKPVLVHSK